MSQDSYHTLVVDDEPQVRDLTCRALGRLNFWCDKAANGEEALQMLAARKYDLMVTDLRMPVTHGHTLCATVLAKPQPPQVVVLTGIADGRLVKDLLSRGVADVIHKPVPYDVLATKIQALFERDKCRDPKSGKSDDQRLEEIEQSILAIAPQFADRFETAFASMQHARIHHRRSSSSSSGWSITNPKGWKPPPWRPVSAVPNGSAAIRW